MNQILLCCLYRFYFLYHKFLLQFFSFQKTWYHAKYQVPINTYRAVFGLIVTGYCDRSVFLPSVTFRRMPGVVLVEYVILKIK